MALFLFPNNILLLHWAQSVVLSRIYVYIIPLLPVLQLGLELHGQDGLSHWGSTSFPGQWIQRSGYISCLDTRCQRRVIVVSI